MSSDRRKPEEFAAFCEERHVRGGLSNPAQERGGSFRSLSEGEVAIRRPEVDSGKLVEAVGDLRRNPERYVREKSEPQVNPYLPMRPRIDGGYCEVTGRPPEDDLYEEVRFRAEPETRRGVLGWIWAGRDFLKCRRPRKFKPETPEREEPPHPERYERIDEDGASPHYCEIEERPEELIDVDVPAEVVVEEYLEPRRLRPVDEMLRLFEATFSGCGRDAMCRCMRVARPLVSNIAGRIADLVSRSLAKRRGRSERVPLETAVPPTERPLPVPVEDEFYYMEIGREDAESLLEGQPDGTFILRPSTQSRHAYTVTLTYRGRVYNIGCRRRHDGRLALGFGRPNEPSFLTVHDLVDHYYEERLVLLVDGRRVGSTSLKRLHP